MKTRFTTLISVWAFILTMLLSISSCSKSNEPINPKKETNNPTNSLGLYTLYADVKNNIKETVAKPLNENVLRSITAISKNEQKESLNKSYTEIISEVNLTPVSEQFFLKVPEWVLDGVQLPSTYTISQLDIPEEKKQKMIVMVATIDAFYDIYESEGGRVSGDSKGNSNEKNGGKTGGYDSMVEACFDAYVDDLVDLIGESIVVGGVVALTSGPAVLATLTGVAASAAWSMLKAYYDFNQCMRKENKSRIGSS